MPANRRFLFVRRPDGMPVPEDFKLVSEETPALADGQFLVRNHYASLDPAMRGWMDDVPSYLPPIPLGEVMRASTVGEVVESRSADFPVGQWVSGMTGIEEYSLGYAGGFTRPIQRDLVPSPTHFLSVLGGVGMTAYFGLLDICQPKAGDTVLVSGAAGAVGSIVGQIAKIKGCRTIGIAGGPEKCARLIERYGYDAAIDYRGKSVDQLTAEIKAVAPDGVDVIFENVGGDVMDAGLNNLKMGARIGLCGLISEYNNAADAGRTGARNIWQLIVHRASIRGIMVIDFIPRFAEGAVELSNWVRSGQLVFDEHIDVGIENALPAFLRLFAGTNDGKMILQLAE